MSEALKKNGLQKVIKVDGKEYTIQKLPFYSYLQLNDRHKNKYGVLMQAPYVKELFEHCVVDPKVDVTDFNDNFEAAGELVEAIENFHSPRK